MKKTIYILTVIALIFAFSSCKKGAEDPSISLLSRKARLTGKWEMTSGQWQTINYTDKKGGSLFSLGKKDANSYDTYIYDNNKLTIYSVIGDEKDTVIYDPFEFIMRFNRDHTFRILIYSKQVNNDYKDTYIEENWEIIKGNWFFLSKAGEYKNKERVYLEFRQDSTKVKYTYQNGDSDISIDVWNYSGTSMNYEYTMFFNYYYILDFLKLANKELKININYSIKDDNGKLEYSEQGTITFNKKK